MGRNRLGSGPVRRVGQLADGNLCHDRGGYPVLRRHRCPVDGIPFPLGALGDLGEGSRGHLCRGGSRDDPPLRWRYLGFHVECGIGFEVLQFKRDGKWLIHKSRPFNGDAMALGKGAALGVDLWTKAEVILTDDPKIIKGEIISDLTEDITLIEKTTTRVFQYFNVENKLGAKIKTWSNIPIARGLKSSSAAANAVVLATLKALNKQLDDLSIVIRETARDFHSNRRVDEKE